jgi:hypothetical protein
LGDRSQVSTAALDVNGTPSTVGWQIRGERSRVVTLPTEKIGVPGTNPLELLRPRRMIEVLARPCSTRGAAMTQHNDSMGIQANDRGRGMLGVIKLFVAFAVLAIGGMAIAFVFDVLPRAMLEALAMKVVVSTVIVLVVVTAVAFLSRSK